MTTPLLVKGQTVYRVEYFTKKDGWIQLSTVLYRGMADSIVLRHKRHTTLPMRVLEVVYA